MKKYTFIKALALVVYGTTAHSMFASTLSSPVDDEAFSQKQRQAMAKLGAPVQPPAAQPGNAPNGSQIKTGDISVKAVDDAKVAFVVGKSSSDAEIRLGDVEVSAEGKSKAVGILNKSGGTSSDIEAGNVSVKAVGNSQAYGFVDDASDW